MGVRLAGDLIDDEDERGVQIVGDTLMILLNAHHEPVTFTLPPAKPGQRWERVLDTSDDDSEPLLFEDGGQYSLGDRSLVVLQTRAREKAGEQISAVHAEAMRRESRPPGPGRPPLD
jgi:glycogen operon protein